MNTDPIIYGDPHKGTCIRQAEADYHACANCGLQIHAGNLYSEDMVTICHNCGSEWDVTSAERGLQDAFLDEPIVTAKRLIKDPYAPLFVRIRALKLFDQIVGHTESIYNLDAVIQAAFDLRELGD